MTQQEIEKIIDARIFELDNEFFSPGATHKQLDDIHARTQELYHMKKLFAKSDNTKQFETIKSHE
jgi:hypothetical protein